MRNLPEQVKKVFFTGKSLSETLIFASINPQYDNRLFMEWPWKLQAQNMGRVHATIRASEKDLPVWEILPE